MLALCIAHPKAGREYLERLVPEHFTSPVLTQVLERLREHLEDPLAGLSDEDSRLYRAIVWLRSVDVDAATDADFRFLWQQLERERKRRELKAAEAEGDFSQVVALQREVAELSDSHRDAALTALAR